MAPDLASAQRAVTAVRSGKDLASAMAAEGLKSSGATDDGEEFYFAAEQHLGSDAVRHCQATARWPGVRPLADGGRVHVLAMQHNRQPVPEDYSQARDRVLADYRTDKIARMRAGTDRFLRERADVQIAKAFQ